MVDVGQDDPIDLAGGQLRIVDIAQHRDDAGHPVALGELLHHVQHFRLDVDAIDPALGRNTLGHPARIVAGTAAHVGDDVAHLESHRVEHSPWLLFLDPLVALEPLRTPKAHEVGRHAVPLDAVRLLRSTLRRRR